MSKYRTTPQKIEKWKKQGRGQGEKKSYRTWLTHRDLPRSRGWRLRIHGNITDRTQYYLSKGEASGHRLLDVLSETDDIREQFPLSLDDTVPIASRLGIDHPTDPETGCLVVMTTDIVWFTKDGNEYPIDVKEEKELENPRVIEKLEIARSTWALHRRRWKLLIAKTMPVHLVANCLRFHKRFYLDGLGVGALEVWDVATLMTEQVCKAEKTLDQIAEDTDVNLGFKAGTSLAIAFHFMARNFWRVDWHKPQEANTVIQLFGYDQNFDFSKSFRMPGYGKF